MSKREFAHESYDNTALENRAFHAGLSYGYREVIVKGRLVSEVVKDDVGQIRHRSSYRQGVITGLHIAQLQQFADDRVRTSN